MAIADEALFMDSSKASFWETIILAILGNLQEAVYLDAADILCKPASPQILGLCYYIVVCLRSAPSEKRLDSRLA